MRNSMKIAIGVIGGLRGGGGLTAVYKNILSAMIAPPPVDIQKKQNRFVKTISPILSKFDYLRVVTSNVDDSLIYWNNPTKRAVIVNTPAFVKYKGFKGDLATNSYINTKFNPRTQASNFKLADNSFGYWSPSLHSASKRIMGVNSNGSMLFFASSATASLIRNNNTAGDTITLGAQHGLIQSNRTGASSTQAYLNGVKKHDGITAVMATLPNVEVFELCENNAGTANAITDGFISVAWAASAFSETESLLFFNAVKELIEGYFIKNVKSVVPDTIEGVAQTCTGMAINTILAEIYIVSAIENDIYVYDYDLNFKRKFSPPTGAYVAQGLTWDSTRNVFLSWHSNLNMYVFTETELIKSYTFDAYSGVHPAGSLAYNNTDDCLYVMGAGIASTGNIKMYTYNGTSEEWEFSANIPATLGDEGICYDVDTDTIWYNRNDGFIANVQKNGTLIELHKLPLDMLGQNE